MSASLTFTVPGRAQPKGRPRVGKNRRTGRVVVYTPASTRAYERSVAQAAMVAVALHNAHRKGGDRWPIDEKYRVELRVLTTSTKIVADLDNCAKSVLDGCNGVTWSDDRQVVDLRIRWVLDDTDGVDVDVEVM